VNLRRPLLAAGVVLAGLLAARDARADEFADHQLLDSEYRAESGSPCATHDIVLNGCCRRVDCCGWPVDECGNRLGRFEATLEGSLSWLASPKGPLGEETGAADQIRWDSLGYGASFGGRGALQYALTPFDRVQVRGAYLGSWDDSTTETGVFGFAPPATTSGVQTVPLHSEAKMWTGEGSWVRQLACGGVMRVDGLLGLRVISFDETATTKVLPAVGGPPPGSVSCESKDFFYGAQLGMGAHLDVSPKFEILVQGKALLGVVHRDITVDDGGVFTVGAKSNSATSNEFGFGAEGEAVFRWRLSSHVAVTGGYSILWLDGIVRANQGMDFSQANTNAVQPRTTTDNVVVNTVFLGVSLTF
jgi:hypothetical protein